MKSAAATPPYTLNHPRWYRKRVSTYWWLQRWEYLRFVLREISSVFVAIFVVEMLLQIYALSLGPEAYADFQSLLKNPVVIALNVVSFFFVVFHSITWFNLSARAMSIRVGGKKVPGFMISGPNFAAWFVISAVIAWLLLRG
jgi:succinate dehydrogenase subunit C